MAKAKSIDPANVVWHAPETIFATLPEVAERMSEQLAAAEGVEETLRIAHQASGEFREYLGEEEVEGRIVPKYGSDRLVWVNDSPDDAEDGSGHYEVYSGPDEEYAPVLQAPKEEG